MRTLWIVAIVALLAAVVLASGGSGGGGSGDGGSGGNGGSQDNGFNSGDDPRHDNDRELQIENGNNELKITSKSKVNGSKSEWEFSITTHEDDYRLEVETRYKVQTGNVQNVSRFDLAFAGLVEYIDVNAPGWQQGEQVKTTSFGKWGAAQCAQNGQLYNCSVATINNAPKVITTFTFAGNPVDVNSKPVDPNEIKISVYITGYPYTFTNTSLALQLLVRQQSDYKEKSGKAGPAIQVSGAGFFQWEDTVSVVYADGTSGTADVIQTTTTSNRSDVVNFMYFSFAAPQAKNIFWDPYVGVGAASSAAGIVISYVVLVLAALFALVF